MDASYQLGKKRNSLNSNPNDFRQDQNSNHDKNCCHLEIIEEDKTPSISSYNSPE